MASRSQTYQRVANVPFSSGFLGDRWGNAWNALRRRGFMNSKLLGFTPNQAINFFAGSDDMARMYGGLTHSGQQVTRAGQASLWTVGKAGGFSAAAKTAGLGGGPRRVGGSDGILRGPHRHHGPREGVGEEQGRLSGQVGLNASLTAAIVAPNPVTIGLAAGTGVVYGGLKVVEHWDDITEGAGKAADWVGDKASDIGTDIADGGKELGSALNPFD